MEEDFTNKTDDQLISITTIPPNNAAHRAAAIELHKRRKQYEDKNLLLQGKNVLLQKWILRLTIAIFILTIIAVVFAVLSYKPLNMQPHKEHTKPQQQNENQQNRILKPTEKVTK